MLRLYLFAAFCMQGINLVRVAGSCMHDHSFFVFTQTFDCSAAFFFPYIKCLAHCYQIITPTLDTD